MIRRMVLGLLKKMKFLPPELYVKIHYEYYLGSKLDLENPSGFNEKIQWIKVFYQPEILTQLVDKYAVRSYVIDKIGESYLNKVLLIADNLKDFDFDILPDEFVVKATHACNFNLIVKDKKHLNKFKAKLSFKKWLSRNQYYRGGLEWAYKNVKPRLIVEKLMKDIENDVLIDYKFYCFSGKPTLVQVDVDRGAKHARHFYDMNWIKQPFVKGNFEYTKEELPEPINFTKMIEIAEVLADDFPFVRVDLYNIQGKIIFGEMTFYPGDGRHAFKPFEYEYEIGRLLKLPEKT
jgi:hypothetical protein